MGYTEYSISRAGFIADDNASERVSRQVDFERVPDSYKDGDGNKIVEGSTIVSQLASGKVVPRTSTSGDITNLTETGETATATQADHGYEVGDIVTIEGAAETGYNGTWTIASVPTDDSYTFDVGATVSDDGGGATAHINAVGILETTAAENANSASLSGQSLLIGGVVYGTLLADADDDDFETFKTELKAISNWWFEDYADSRAN
ncbi:MAG: hypothetical protein ABJG33_00095 [Balneola sp.]